MKRLITLSITLLLSGCASLNSHFDCKMKPGVLCKSLDQVNTMVDRGELGHNVPCVDCNKANCTKNKTHYQSVSTADFNTPYPLSSIGVGDPLRYGETVLKVWFAPYEDKDHNYYQPVTIFTVVKSGHWIGMPVRAIDADGERV